VPITQFAIINAKPSEKDYKLADGAGLHLLVQRNGSKLWRFRYKFGGRENMLTFGPFPATSLSSARTKRDEARALLASGMNPSVKRKLDKIASVTAARNTFGDVAADHLAHMESQRHRRDHHEEKQVDASEALHSDRETTDRRYFGSGDSRFTQEGRKERTPRNRY
jgi:Arm DNA-binding domain